MGRFIESLLRCILYFFLSWFAGTVVVGFASTVIENITSDGAIRELMRVIIETITVCILVYIVMYRSGRKGDITTFTGEKSVKEIIAPIIISVLLIHIIPVLNEMHYIIGLPPGHRLYVASQSKTEIVISLLPRFGLQSILYVILMILGYNRGHKKHDN